MQTHSHQGVFALADRRIGMSMKGYAVQGLAVVDNEAAPIDDMREPYALYLWGS